MNIQFDTDTLTLAEAQGLTSLVASLFPKLSVSAPGPVSGPVTSIALVPATAPAAQPEAQPVQPSQPTPPEAPAQPASAAVVAEQPAKRHRRTKAEIEADEAAAKQAPVTEAPAAPTTTAAADAKPIDADDLRFLLNGYIAKHSMEEAIGQLQAFGCNRVTEALALDPAKLNSLAEVLRG